MKLFFKIFKIYSKAQVFKNELIKYIFYFNMYKLIKNII